MSNNSEYSNHTRSYINSNIGFPIHKMEKETYLKIYSYDNYSTITNTIKNLQG